MNKQSRRQVSSADVEVGHRLRAQRLTAGLSQQKLAERLGLTFQQVQKYEKGTNRIGAGRLFEIADILSVPVEFFFGTVSSLGPPEPADALHRFALSTEGLKLCRAFMALKDQATRRKIMELLRALAGEPDEE